MAFTREVPNFIAEGTALPESTLVNGFKPGEKPPANWFNFLYSTICQAIMELQEKSYEKEKLPTDLADYLTKAIIKQVEGDSTTDVMSQKAVKDYVTNTTNKMPSILKGSSNPTGGKNGDIYIKYS